MATVLSNSPIFSNSSSNSTATSLDCKYIVKSSNDELGDGNFSIVKKCQNTLTGGYFAMKKVHKNLLKGKMQLIQREINLLQFLSQKIRQIENESSEDSINNLFDGHHHVLQLFDYFETKNSIILITQLCEKGDLYEKIVSNSCLDLNRQVVPYTACLISALGFLHDNDIVHRDIKAENVLFRRNMINSSTKNSETTVLDYDTSSHDLILADFGLATHIHQNDPNSKALKEYVGTMSYIAPEIVCCRNVSMMDSKQLKNLKPYDEKIDIWALAVLVYFMALGYTPFDCDNDEETLDCISKNDYYIDEDLKDDPKFKQFWDFLKICFQIDSKKRPSMKKLQSHPFVNKFFPNSLSQLNTISEYIESPIPSDLTPPTPFLKRSSSTYSLKSPSKTPSGFHLFDSSSKTSKSTYNYSSSPLTEISSSSSSLLNKPSMSPSILTEPAIVITTTMQTSRLQPNLRRTSSLTNVNNSKSKVLHSSNSTINKVKKNSTFILEPVPPKTSLMNGCLSTTPKVLSRKNSAASLVLSIENDSIVAQPINNSILSENRSHPKPIFTIDDYVDNENNL
ncbi:hypothetical protein TBLA_0C06820 [Henningerozyma blattae CBS 6284]|uniref:Protein kinase domain-containing protein n=1 Tax=Henningerozyma blattae (strain ATCC 34711 / CBS 6284 / DSM 70876 / NBRC 10599 / NRRL Y-10934 / UCD 77-7) TaxID=1071380 RepID=I2H272_HENB6|nr:hypothetical protein TBLA_0C06820 [Tetrapisispora blattae CBS 6284]CCH60474.1 hypothetical protein TBLA_0C06820 [Tetrapisispora blattae CBS 6284]